MRESDGRPSYVPTDDEASLMAKQVGVPCDYLPKFFDEISSSGWGYVNRGGSYVALNRRNFKYVLSAFWKSEKKKRKESADQGGNGNAFRQEGYKVRLGKKEAN